MLTPADGFERLTHQLDLSIPVGVRRLSFATYLFVQYFNGYAESLRNYRHESQSVRMGVSLVR
jgi:outer membrane phospholipase A